MDNYKAPLAAVGRVRNFSRDIENAMNDAGLPRDDWAGGVSDIGNFANWRSAANHAFTSDAAFAAEELGFDEPADGSDPVLFRELNDSFLGDTMFSGEEFHDGMFNIFHDDDDDDSWDSDWDSSEQDYY